MNDFVNVVLLADLFDQLFIRDVALEKWNRTDSAFGSQFKRIEHHDFALLLRQQAHGVRTDVSGTTGNKNSHGITLTTK